MDTSVYLIEHILGFSSDINQYLYCRDMNGMHKNSGSKKYLS